MALFTGKKKNKAGSSAGGKKSSQPTILNLKPIKIKFKRLSRIHDQRLIIAIIIIANFFLFAGFVDISNNWKTRSYYAGLVGCLKIEDNESQENHDNITKLNAAFSDFENQLFQGRGSNKVVYDALPTSHSKYELEQGIEQIFKNGFPEVAMQVDEDSSGQPSYNPEVQQTTFSLSIDFTGAKKLDEFLYLMERSIRPMKVLQMSITIKDDSSQQRFRYNKGLDSSLYSVSLEVATYWQPKKRLNSEQIQFSDTNFEANQAGQSAQCPNQNLALGTGKNLNLYAKL